jgi:amino acid adenylation domain-containing protein
MYLNKYQELILFDQISRFLNHSEVYNLFTLRPFQAEEFDQIKRCLSSLKLFFPTLFECVDPLTKERVLLSDFNLPYTFVQIDNALEDTINLLLEETVFTLKRGDPLIKVYILQHSSKPLNYICLIMHHLLVDGASTIYVGKWIDSFIRQESISSMPNTSNSVINTESIDSINSWKPFIESFSGFCNLPYDRICTEVRHGNAKEIKMDLPRKLKQPYTLFLMYHSFIRIFLHLWLQTPFVATTSPFDTRIHSGRDEEFGMWMNNLPYLVVLDPEDTIQMYLHKMKDYVQHIVRNGDVTIMELTKTYSLPYLSEWMTNVHFLTESYTFEEEKGIRNRRCKEDFRFHLSKQTLLLDYDPSRFDECSMDLCAKKFQFCYHQFRFCSNDTPISLLSLLLEEEMTLTRSLNLTEKVIDSSFTFLSLLQYSWAHYGDQSALSCEIQNCSYNEFITNIINYASLLRRVYGICKNDIVMVSIPRSSSLVVSIFSILLCESTYFPIHHDTSLEKIKELYWTSKSKIIICEQDRVLSLQKDNINAIFFSLDPTETTVPADIRYLFNESSDHVAYIIPTSGTTGSPKLVQIEMHSLLNFTFHLSRMQWGNGKRHLQLCQISFDVHLQEVVCTLLLGGTLVLEPIFEIEKVLDTIKTKKIDVLTSVPSVLEMLIRSDINQSLEPISEYYLIGEPLKSSLTTQLFNKYGEVIVYNTYGPAECTIYTHYFKITKETAERNISLGTPIENVSYYLLDDRNQEVGCMTPGELYLSGKCLMKGYLHTDSSQVLITHPLYGLLYKTGDICKRDLQGLLYYLERRDRQEKIRGQRVNTGEIESIIQQHPLVSEVCILIDKEDQQNTMLCFIRGTIEERDLFQWMKEKLLLYMIPNYIIKKDYFPLSQNGKLDKKALVKIFQEQKNNRANKLNNTLSYSKTEQIILDCFFNIAGKSCSIEDPLYSLGLNSLQLTQVLYHLNKYNEQEFDLSISDISSFVFLKDFIALLDRPSSSRVGTVPSAVADNINVVIENTPYLASSSQKMIYLHHMFHRSKDYTVYNMSFLYDVPLSISYDDIKHVYNLLLQSEPIFRTKYVWNKTLYQVIVPFSDIRQDCVMVSSFDKIIKRPFDIDNGPMIRFAFCLDRHELLIQAHHISYDELSHQVFQERISSLFERQDVYVPPMHYITYAEEERKRKQTETYRRSIKFWNDYLENQYAFIQVFPPCIDASKKGSGIISWSLSKLTCGSLTTYSSRLNTSIHHILLGLFLQFLHRVSKQPIFYIGSLFHNRVSTSLFSLIGYVMKLFRIRSTYSDLSNLDLFIVRWSDHLNEIIGHANVDIEDIETFNTLNAKQNTSMPFASLMFTQIPSGTTSISTPRGSLTSKEHSFISAPPIFPLTMFVEETSQDQIKGFVQYDSGIYKEEGIQSYLHQWEKWMNELCI